MKIIKVFDLTMMQGLQQKDNCKETTSMHRRVAVIIVTVASAT